MAWQRLPGKSRQYQNTDTGQKLSRRQYDKMMETAGRRTRMGEARRAGVKKASADYWAFATMYARKYNLNKNQARASEHFNRNYRAFLRESHKGTKEEKDLLILLGMREGVSYEVRVGDTDKWRRGNYERNAGLRGRHRGGSRGYRRAKAA